MNDKVPSLERLPVLLNTGMDFERLLRERLPIYSKGCLREAGMPVEIAKIELREPFGTKQFAKFFPVSGLVEDGHLKLLYGSRLSSGGSTIVQDDLLEVNLSDIWEYQTIAKMYDFQQD